MGRYLTAAVLSATIVMGGAAFAQHAGHGPAHGLGTTATPYVGQDKRGVASLSDGDVAALLDGKGMGFARPAELNGYPGPMHILELAEELELSTTQRAEIEGLFQQMKTRARAAGEAYVAAEMALDAAFKTRNADTQSVAQLTRDADQKRAEKRLTHLDAHIEARRILTETQRQRYATLRGYGTK